EAFLRAKNNNGPTGAIASVGSSILMAWAEPMDTQDEIGDIMSNIYANNKKYTLGGLFYNGQMHMLDMYPTATGEEVMETWVMFGDPSVMIRTQTPSNLTVNHFHCLKDVATTFSISSSAGPNAFACLTQNGQIIGAGPLTGATTNIALTNTFSLVQDVILTVTEFNKIPKIDTIPVCITTSVKKLASSENFYIKNPVQNNQLEIFYKNIIPGEADVKIFNLQGKMVLNTNIYVSANGRNAINLDQLESSVYLVQITGANNQRNNFKIIKE
ncbi:MAG: T9SS type A sorting domain-containing protein, partial [Bacteroidia bacterium]|nr:T9SS type A sorting domain-containing protein [Bacteroidia bacterium]